MYGALILLNTGLAVKMILKHDKEALNISLEVERCLSLCSSICMTASYNLEFLLIFRDNGVLFFATKITVCEVETVNLCHSNSFCTLLITVMFMLRSSPGSF